MKELKWIDPNTVGFYDQPKVLATNRYRITMVTTECAEGLEEIAVALYPSTSNSEIQWKDITPRTWFGKWHLKYLLERISQQERGMIELEVKYIGYWEARTMRKAREKDVEEELKWIRES